MGSQLKYFYGSFAFCALAGVTAYFAGGPKGAMTVCFLAVLEASLSFDNAIVNATVLRGWDQQWRRRFLVWGMPVAVFGMRLLFPLAIVAIAAGVGPLDALRLAIDAPETYGRILSSAHHRIAAFGGAFLSMVFLQFFVDRHKTEHWFSVLERPLIRLGKMESVEAALTLALLMLVSLTLGGETRAEFIAAGVWGVVSFILVRGLAAFFGGDAEAGAGVVRQGVAGFLYLELLDASFSFDGVAGAFAMTDNLLVICLGLGAGAMFVRSFTLLLVERGSLETYRYLEHGAFWAIGALAAIMLASVRYEVPEAVTGLLGASLIGLSLASSILSNRKNARMTN